MKKFNELRNNEKGFTLIELIIVIAILAIIAAVAVPNIIGAVDNSRRSADIANAKIILNAAAQVQASNDSIAVPASGTIIDVSNIAAPAGAVDNFSEALMIELNSTTITPKYKGTGVGAVDRFLITVGSNGSMTVSSADKADGSAINVQVAPTPDAAYNQQ